LLLIYYLPSANSHNNTIGLAEHCVLCKNIMFINRSVLWHCW